MRYLLFTNIYFYWIVFLYKILTFSLKNLAIYLIFLTPLFILFNFKIGFSLNMSVSGDYFYAVLIGRIVNVQSFPYISDKRGILNFAPNDSAGLPIWSEFDTWNVPRFIKYQSLKNMKNWNICWKQGPSATDKALSKLLQFTRCVNALTTKILFTSTLTHISRDAFRVLSISLEITKYQYPDFLSRLPWENFFIQFSF